MKSEGKFRTEQESFWAGQFGAEYIDRNKGDLLLAANLNFFTHALKQAGQVGSCLEFGANIGMNLRALKLLYPNMKLEAIEINPNTAKDLRLVDYGFSYHRDRAFPQDDITWFLLEKR